ncbi:MAG: YceI family protein [Cytophagaceae bacterium]|jgi:polyisoprenoid-binding protein YceI|nr:YceI family protein [Cytophagaceae bacterium]
MISKKMVTCLLLCSSLTLLAQGKYKTGKSEVRFFSTTPIENIEAKNKDTKGVVDFDAKKFSLQIPIKSFDFPSDLMEEHFNENYLESAKFPTATYKGSFTGTYDLSKDGEYALSSSGDLTIHGVTKQVNIPVTLTVKNGLASITSKFNVKLEDYSIKVPTVVFNKIAEVVEVTVNAQLEKM